MLGLMLLMCLVLVVLIGLCFVLGKMYTVKMILGFIIMCISAYIIPSFYKLQRDNGNPDAGKEFGQLYFPIIIFTICLLLGIAISINAQKKSKRKD